MRNKVENIALLSISTKLHCLLHAKEKGKKRIGLKKHTDVVIDNKKLQNEVSQNAEVCMIQLKKATRELNIFMHLEACFISSFFVWNIVHSDASNSRSVLPLERMNVALLRKYLVRCCKL